MEDYRLYHFERGHIAGVEFIAADDDQNATADARQRVNGKMAELWRGAVRVETFDSQ